MGREDDPRGRVRRAAEAPPRAGPAALRRRRRPRQRAGAEGDPLRDRVGPARGRGGVRGAPAGSTPWAPGALAALRRGAARRFVWGDLRQVRNMRPGVRRAGFRLGGAVAGMATVTRGRFPPRRPRDRARRRARRCSRPTARSATRRPTASSRSTSSRRCSSRATGRATTSRTTSASQTARAARARRAVGAHVPGAGVRGRRRARATATVDVEVTPSNCVQCGAITAKGGRLTPPEGGSGPEYTLHLSRLGLRSERRRLTRDSRAP